MLEVNRGRPVVSFRLFFTERAELFGHRVDFVLRRFSTRDDFREALAGQLHEITITVATFGAGARRSGSHFFTEPDTFEVMNRRVAFVFVVALGCGGAQTAPPPLEIPVVHPEVVDRSAPATWIARLDDDKRRSEAVDWLTKAYVRGGLDDATRLALIKALTSLHDPRTSPALVQALGGYEPGKTDEDVKLAAQCVVALATSGTPIDASVADALWIAFAKYRPSRTNSIMGTQALHDAILAVKDPSYGEKALTMITSSGVIEDKLSDEIQFSQLTAIQVIKVLAYKRAARALVAVLVTRGKIGLATLARSALMQMPVEATPELVAALKSSDKSYVPILLDVLGTMSVDAARDAVLAFVPQLDNDTNRAAAATTLVWYAPTASTVPTFKRIYEKLPPISENGDSDTGVERAQLLGVASEFFDPALGPWALAQSSNAMGSSLLAAKVDALQSAIKLMRPADKPLVVRALANLEIGLSPKEKQMVADNVRDVFKRASAALDKCAMNASCYVQLTDEPIPDVSNGNWKVIKAAHMAGMLGNDQTRRELVARVAKVTNPGARIAIAVAINHLAPKGDAADADALEKIVADDTERKDAAALRGDDALTKVALMLRARVSP